MPFTVHLRPSGKTFTVENKETVLEAALRQHIALPYGCRNGACGACLGKLLTGEIQYSDPPPDALPRLLPELGDVLLCKAKPLCNLELEVTEVAIPTAAQALKLLPCRVQALRALAHDVMQLFLTLPQTERISFLAGQYVDLILADGRRRSFSLANPPHANENLELHIRLVPGGIFTSHVFASMKPGDLLRVEGPLGSFFLREDSTRPIIMIAGGTGFAPVKAMVESMIEKQLQHPVHFYWGARAKRDLYMDGLARIWMEELPKFQYTPVLSEPLAEDGWAGRTGFVHDAVLQDYTDVSGHDVYACGPPPMVRGARDGLLAQGLPEAHFYSDSFEFAKS